MVKNIKGNFRKSLYDYRNDNDSQEAFIMKRKMLTALLIGGSIMLTACGENTNTVDAKESSSATESVTSSETDSEQEASADAASSESSENKHSEKNSESKSKEKGGSKKKSESSDSSTTAASSTLQDGDEITGETYTATESDESAVYVSGDITASISGSTIQKSSGDATSADDSSFYGVNAAVRVYGNATLTIKDSKITADAENATGVFAYENGTIYISDSTVDVTGGGAGGIQVAGGGTLYANNLTVTSASKAAIRSDRGGGTLVVDGGVYTSTGSSGCPAIYSTAEITVSNADCISENSRAVIIEGKNSVTLNDCTLTGNDQSTKEGSIKANVLLYQSASGDADEGTSVFTMNGGSMTSNSGAMFYCTNTASTINLNNADLTLSDAGSLLIVSSGRWGKDGNNGGDCTMNATDQKLEGSITVDEISSLEINLSNSTYEGAINEDGAAGNVTVNLNDGSTWTLTGDSYISDFEGDLDSITANGHHLYVNGKQVL